MQANRGSHFPRPKCEPPRGSHFPWPRCKPRVTRILASEKYEPRGGSRFGRAKCEPPHGSHFARPKCEPPLARILADQNASHLFHVTMKCRWCETSNYCSSHLCCDAKTTYFSERTSKHIGSHFDTRKCEPTTDGSQFDTRKCMPCQKWLAFWQTKMRANLNVQKNDGFASPGLRWEKS